MLQQLELVDDVVVAVQLHYTSSYKVFLRDKWSPIMETAVQKLEILFSQAEQELALLSTKVDAQYNLLDKQDQELPHQQNSYSSDFTTSNSLEQVPKNSSSSVTSVIAGVHQLRSELTKVSKDVATLQQQQQQVMQSVQLELSSLADHFTALTAAVGNEADLPELPVLDSEPSSATKDHSREDSETEQAFDDSNELSQE